MRFLHQTSPSAKTVRLVFPSPKALSAWAAVVVCCLGGSLARADQLNVVSTGMNVDANGIDLSYKLTTSADPMNAGPNAFLVQQLAPPWLPNQANSKWIAPRANESFDSTQAIGNASVGTYIYETHFTVPSNAILTTGVISGQLAVDNQLTDVVLNGNHLHITTPLKGSNPENLGYAVQFYPFSITSGFQVGDNVLDFFVANLFDTTGPNPTGVQIQMTGSIQTVSTVPEPSTLALAGMGVFGLLGYRWRRQKA